MKEESPLENIDPDEYLHDIEANSPGNHAAPAPAGHPRPQKDLMSLLSPPWPLIEPTAYHGLVGRLVETISPHSEADPVALLIGFLVGFGNLIGDSAYFDVEKTPHPCRLFATLVGETSKSRKGSSWGHVKNYLKQVDPKWGKKCIGSGLSSGEGLIYAVRDPIKSKTQDDPGAEDKRLMVVEGEFVRTLSTIRRESNTLSPVIRDAWDSGDLRIINKNTPITATGAHISIIGHITKEELNKRLGDTDIFNGLANRFLWICVKRSKYLPEGGNLKAKDIAPLVKQLREAADFSKSVKIMGRTKAARKLWADEYRRLSEGGTGLLGAATNRAEAQVMRIADIYALLDESRLVKPAHLSAALALWDYSFQSCQYIFGDKGASKDLVSLVEALSEAHPKGLSRTDIRDLFHRHRGEEEIDRMLSTLREAGIAQAHEVKTEGRSTQLWTLADAATKATKDPL